ncbi:hypothetical protein lerEdw1_006915 [Lerista edwardsae]|nr:hypothetical protein lerEdw1_006915 [Lerista edwardsae]
MAEAPATEEDGSIPYEEPEDGTIKRKKSKRGNKLCESEDDSICDESEEGSIHREESEEASRMAESRKGSMKAIILKHRDSQPMPDVDLVVLPPSLENVPDASEEDAAAAPVQLLKEFEASRLAESRRGSMPAIILKHRDSLTIPDIDLVAPPPPLENGPDASEEAAAAAPVHLLEESEEASYTAESRKGSMPAVTLKERVSLPMPDVDLAIPPPSLENGPDASEEAAAAAPVHLLEESEEASYTAESRKGSMPAVTFKERDSLPMPDVDLAIPPPSLENGPDASEEAAAAAPVHLLEESKEASYTAKSRKGSMPAVTFKERDSLPMPDVDLVIPPPSLENGPDASEEAAAAAPVHLLEESEEASYTAESRKGSMPAVTFKERDSLPMPDVDLVIPPPSLENGPDASEEAAAATPVHLLKESEEASYTAESRKGSMPAANLTGRDSLAMPDVDLVVPPPSLENVPDASEEGAAATPVRLLRESDFTLEKVLSETKGGLLPSPELIVTSSNDQDEEDEDDLCLDGEAGLTRAHVMTCRICQLFVRTVDRLLDKSEELMDQYLPLTEEEIGNLQQAIQELDTPNADSQMQACLARITDLSSQLRQRAYMLALSKLRLARQNTQESFCQLHQTITLIEQVQQGEESQVRASHLKLNEMCKSWAERQGMRVSTIDISSTNEQEEEEDEEEDEQEEVIMASRGRDDSVAFPSEFRGRDDSMAFPGEDRGREDSVAFPGEDRGREDSVAFPGEDRGREDSMAFPSEDIEEPETYPDKSSHLMAPRTPLHEDRSRIESGILRTEDRFKEEAERASEGSRRKDSRRIQIDALSKDEAQITITVPGCEKEDGFPLPRPHRTKSRRLTLTESSAQETETSALEMSRGLVSHLQDTYQGLLVNLQDVPSNLKNKLQHTCQHMAELQASFARAANFGELGSSVLNNSLNIMAEAEGNMDDLMDFAFQNPIGLIAESTEKESQEAAQPEVIAQPSNEEKDKKEEEEDRHDILKLQKAYDPKGCEGED